MSDALHKSIKFFPLTMIAAGACIGSGIFIAPSDVAKLLGTGNEILVVWLIGGIVAMTGALTFAELASRFPGTGGVYLYLREAYGDLVAFLYGWCILTVITSGALAGLCLVFARYLAFVLHLSDDAQIPIAIVELTVVTLINIFGVKFSSLFSSTLTVIKIAGIAMIVAVAMFYGQHLIQNLTVRNHETATVSFGLALIGVLWSYGGWHHASYIGGEVINAQKVLPKALVAGALLVTIIYMSVNVGYLSLLGMEQMATSQAIAADAMMQVTATGGILIAILIAVSTFGTSTIYTLSAPRIYYRMGADKVFFPWLSDVHSKFGTPAKAVLLQSVWAVVLLIFWGTFENLATYVTFMDWIFMTMAAIALFLFRKRMPMSSYSGYKTPLYPVVPLIFIGISLWFLGSTLIGRPLQTLAGLLLMVIGLPVYFYFKRNQQRKVLS
jgi:APA family basic amino acid/polyamine antiporter